MKQSDGGFAPSYNVQISTEASHKIVVAVGVTQAGTDYGQLIEGIDRVKANLGQAPARWSSTVDISRMRTSSRWPGGASS